MTPTDDLDPRPSPSRLYRNPAKGVLFGVCAGIAEYAGVQTWIVRLLAVLALLMFPPPAVVIYLIVAAVLPRVPERLYRDDAEQRFWRDVRVDPSRKFSELRHRFREIEHRLRAMESYVTSKGYRVSREIDDL